MKSPRIVSDFDPFMGDTKIILMDEIAGEVTVQNMYTERHGGGRNCSTDRAPEGLQAQVYKYAEKMGTGSY